MCVNFLAAVLKKTCMPSDRMGCGADDGRCCLIVVPSSVIQQWQSEFERWVHTQVATINKGSDVAPIMRKVHAGSVVEVVIVGHDRFRLSADEICSYDWHLAIFDEGTRLHGHTFAYRRVRGTQCTPNFVASCNCNAMRSAQDEERECKARRSYTQAENEETVWADRHPHTEQLPGTVHFA
jgi:hypothetical protein